MSPRLASPGLLALACLVVLVSAPSAGAALSVVPAGLPQGFEVTTSTAQAGAPTDFVTNFTLTRDSPTPWPGRNIPAGDEGGILRDVIVDLPAGLNGDGEAVPQCAEVIDVSLCPIESQVGLVDVKGVTIVIDPDFILHNRLILPLYNMTPSFGEVARLGSSSAQIGLQLSITLRPGDSGVRVEAHRLSSSFPVISGSFMIWGLPGDPSHDVQRCRQLTPISMSDDFETEPFCDAATGQPNDQPQPFEGEVEPFFVNPTTCGKPRTTSISVSGWDAPGHFETEHASEPPIEGCDQLGFEPKVTLKTDTAAPDTPTGLEFELNMPASGS